MKGGRAVRALKLRRGDRGNEKVEEYKEVVFVLTFCKALLFKIFGGFK
jgi:hypothetical protein